MNNPKKLLELGLVYQPKPEDRGLGLLGAGSKL